MEMKDSVSLQKRGAVMEEKTRKPETAKQTAKEHHVPEHEDEHQHGNPQFALKVLLILIAIILVIVILKATGVPFAVKDWLSHVTAETFQLGGFSFCLFIPKHCWWKIRFSAKASHAPCSCRSPSRNPHC